MKQNLFVAFFIISAVIACRKPVEPRPAPQPKPVSQGDVFTHRLKDVTIRNLPSPYYHFDYNDSGYITNASYVSGLWQYNLGYQGKRLSFMQNNIIVNKDVLEYQYEDGNVTAINVRNEAGNITRRYFFDYNVGRQLTRMRMEVKINNVFVPERTVDLLYYPDENLEKMTTRYFQAGANFDGTLIDRFENYDDKVNAEGFSLLHPDQFHHAFFLPSVKLQLNNARRNIRTGSGNNYEVDYTYTYDSEGQPTVKNGSLRFTSGPDKGKQFSLLTTYTWY